jgi:hypothetical protein
MNPTTIPLHTGTSSYPPHHLSSLLQFHDDANDYRFHLSCDFLPFDCLFAVLPVAGI